MNDSANGHCSKDRLSPIEQQSAVLASNTESTQASDSADADDLSREYLCYFIHRHLSFRKAECEALARLSGCEKLVWREPVGGSFFSPFWYVRLPSSQVACEIASRSMLIKGFYELWGEGSTFQELVSNLKETLKRSNRPPSEDQLSWKIVVDSWGRTMQLQEQIDLINQLSFLDFKGPIRLNGADVVYRLIVTSDEVCNGLPTNTTPQRWYFGREIAVSNRKIVSQYALPARLYIGPTSMDAEMAFVICNMAQVKRGHLVYDPFVGTGSILVAAAHLGAYTIGADIDMRVVRDGKVSTDGQLRDNWANFRQYNLPRPVGLLRLDAHIPAFRQQRAGWLDAVVCDPPYGVRAGGRRSICLSENGSLTETGRRRSEMEAAGAWFPPTKGYTLTECLQDLLQFAAQHLRIGGRLVYFLPAAPDMCKGSNVPEHPALHFVSNCEQVLTRRYSRRLVTMEKWKAFDESDPVNPINPELESNLAKLHEVVYEVREEQPMKQKYRGKVC